MIILLDQFLLIQNLHLNHLHNDLIILINFHFINELMFQIQFIFHFMLFLMEFLIQIIKINLLIHLGYYLMIYFINFFKKYSLPKILFF